MESTSKFSGVKLAMTLWGRATEVMVLGRHARSEGNSLLADVMFSRVSLGHCLRRRAKPLDSMRSTCLKSKFVKLDGKSLNSLSPNASDAPQHSLLCRSTLKHLVHHNLNLLKRPRLNPRPLLLIDRHAKFRALLPTPEWTPRMRLQLPQPRKQ